MLSDEVKATIREALKFKRKIVVDQNPNTFVAEWRQELLDQLDNALAALESSTEWEPVPGAIVWQVNKVQFVKFIDGAADDFKETGYVLCRAKKKATR